MEYLNIQYLFDNTFNDIWEYQDIFFQINFQARIGTNCLICGKECNYSEVSPYFRYTYASYLASSGKVDIYTLKELLGHSTIEMTQRYAHLVNGALKKAVNVADEVFG